MAGGQKNTMLSFLEQVIRHGWKRMSCSGGAWIASSACINRKLFTACGYQGSTLSGQGFSGCYFRDTRHVVHLDFLAVRESQITTRTLVIAAIAVVLFSLFLTLPAEHDFLSAILDSVPRFSPSCQRERWLENSTGRTVCT